jgi:hypothetical protein
MRHGARVEGIPNFHLAADRSRKWNAVWSLSRPIESSLWRVASGFESTRTSELTRVEVATTPLLAALPVQHRVGEVRAPHVAMDQRMPAVAMRAV